MNKSTRINVGDDNDIIEVKEDNQEETINDKSIEYPIFNDELGDTYEECI